MKGDFAMKPTGFTIRVRSLSRINPTIRADGFIKLDLTLRRGLNNVRVDFMIRRNLIIRVELTF